MISQTEIWFSIRITDNKESRYKKVNVNDQEIPNSHTVNQATAP